MLRLAIFSLLMAGCNLTSFLGNFSALELTSPPPEVGYLYGFFTDFEDYYLAPSGGRMYLFWEQAPRSTTETFRYTFFQVASDGTEQVIGTDSDDGYTPSVGWDIPESLHGEAYDQNGALIGIAHSPPDVGATNVPPTPHEKVQNVPAAQSRG